MTINIKQMATGLVIISGISVGIYTLLQDNNAESQEISESVQVASPEAAQARKLQPGESLPANHPPLIPPATSQDKPELERSQADPNAKFTHFKVGNKNVKSIFADGDIMWIGTSGGVIRYDTKTDNHRLFNVQNGLLANGVFHVSAIGDDIAVGTYGGGLAMYDQKQDRFQIYNVPEGLADSFVYDALTMPNGDVWIATWSGANLIQGGDISDPSKWQTFTVANTNGGLPNDWVYGLAKGKDDEVWMATEGGLARYKEGRWTNWNHDDGLGADYELVKDSNSFTRDPADYSSHHAKQKIEMNLQNVNTAYNPNYIVAMDVASDGTVWIGTWGGGLCSFDGEKFTVYTTNDGMPSNHVFMLHIDSNDKIWIGSSKGLAYFEEGINKPKFKVMKTSDGLFDNAIFSMATQNDGTLWIGSYGGLSRIRF